MTEFTHKKLSLLNAKPRSKFSKIVQEIAALPDDEALLVPFNVNANESQETQRNSLIQTCLRKGIKIHTKLDREAQGFWIWKHGNEEEC